MLSQSEYGSETLPGVTQHLGKQEAWQIEGLGFAKPLVLRLEDGKMEEPVELRLVLWEDYEMQHVQDYL